MEVMMKNVMKKLMQLTLLIALAPAGVLAAIKRPTLKRERTEEAALAPTIFARLDGYGWMSRHPLTLLHAASSNTTTFKYNPTQMLHRAVNRASRAAAAKALKAGANPNKVNVHGWSPFHRACSDTRCVELVRLMLAYHADADKTTKQDQAHPALGYGYTAMDIAMANNNHEVVALLSAHEAGI